MWTQFLENADAISSIFDQAPSLQRVRLMRLQLSEDGPTVDLKLALRDFPARPPKRWAAMRANAAILELQLLGVARLSVAGWTTNNVVDIVFNRSAEGSFETILHGEGVRVEVLCLGVRVTHLSACQTAAEGAESPNR